MIVCGWGVLVLGIWSVLRIVLSLSMEFKQFVNNTILPYFSEKDWDYEKLIVTIVIVCIFIISFIDVFIRLMICLSASAEGRGKKKKGFYVVLIVLLLLINLLSIISSVDNFYSDAVMTLTEIIANLLLTVTDFVITADLLVATISVRHERKKREKRKALSEGS